MTEHAPDRIWTGIDIPKTIAGVLATVSAAVLGSFLGVGGTLAGAALASVVGTIGTEIYQRSIHKTAKKLQSSFVTASAAVGTPSVYAAAQEVPSEPEVPDPAVKIRWKRVGAIAAAVFVLAIVTLTAFEWISGRSAAEAVGGKSGSSTTIVSFLTGNSNKDKTGTPKPSTSPSNTKTGNASEAPSNTPTTTPATEPATTTEPAAPATTAPPAVTNTQAPAGSDLQNPQKQGEQQNPQMQGDQQPGTQQRNTE